MLMLSCGIILLHGAEIMLDGELLQVGLAGRLSHRYRGKQVDAKTSLRERLAAAKEAFVAAFAQPAFAPAVA